MTFVIAQLVNYALALFFWLIIGRLALTVLTRGRQGFFMGIFVKGTEPVYAVIRLLTGGHLGDGWVALLALALIVVLRIALLPALAG